MAGVSKDLVLRFMRLFRGSELSYGVLIPDNGIGTARTYDKTAGVAEFTAHLEGTMGLGICPATPEGLVYFAAIDVDNHTGTTNHQGICETVEKLKLPAIVTQTRRKGAHVYFFFPDGVQGSVLVPYLEGLTKHFKKYGDPIEVFPKQRILVGANKGNWINLPYFNADEGHRFAILETQPISLEEFLDWAESNPATIPRATKPTRDSQDKEEIETMNHSEAPPCIQRIFSGGIEEGARNNAIFALGTYLRIRGYEGDLSTALRTWNRIYFSPKLQDSHISDAARRLAGGGYNYRCSDHPLCDMCNREVCVNRAFGVRAKKEDDGSTPAPIITFQGLLKVLTNPPSYKLKVGPEEGEPWLVNVETDELFSFVIVRRKVFDSTGVLVPKMKDSSWEKIVASMNADRREIPAPLDAKPTAAVESAVLEFCRTAERPAVDGTPKLGKPKDLLMGRPVVLLDKETKQANVYFRSQDLELHLRRKRITSHRGRELWMVLAEMGCTYDAVSIDGSEVIAWMKPYTPFITVFEAPKVEERF